MSISYLIAFDKKLNKTEYLYKDILKNQVYDIGDDAKFIFNENLSLGEEEVCRKIFQQRKAYSIHTIIPLGCKLEDCKKYDENYYKCRSTQMAWFIKFLKSHIDRYEDVLLAKFDLQKPITFSNMLSEMVNLSSIEIPINDFEFSDCIYQFVNNRTV